jgi:DNA polymerase-3 subunit alpha
MQFSHLHVHTQYSLLDGASDISKMLKKAKADNMPACAITDHGNMFGVFSFVAEANKQGIKPIVGCEFYIVDDRLKRQFTKEDKDKRYHQLLLAKNAEGYKNLVKLCSLGYMDGLYGKYPRIDKGLVLQYHSGLIATTCCLGAMVPQTILRRGEAEAEKEFNWWLDLFGEDYYIELQRHELREQDQVNEVLMRFAAKYHVKVIASNDSHYINEEDANAHDILLCINTGEKQSTPTMIEFADDDVSAKGKRFAFPNNQFYFKTTEQMSALFHDIPQAIDNTNEIVDKIEALTLKKDILLPHFTVPPEFTSQDDFLENLTWKGARDRYRELAAETEDRIKFELHTIKTMGFAGYFLIVSDFIKAGRDLGVFVGPGRGSAAGSVVAYCIGITNIDPIKYNLLFERFLNPDRKSMPDIDTDFDDEGRQKVIDYVVKKYGKNQVAQIVTYGTMAAKSSIKDVARVMDLPLSESTMLAKLVPDKPGTVLERVMNAPFEGEKSLKTTEGYQSEDIENIKKLREIARGNDLQARVLKEALILEGSVRSTGLHAAGIIIAPKDLSEIIPVATSKETELLITQYEGSIIEDAGVIKMDFLGLKTLTIIRDALNLIKQNYNLEIAIDDIPLDDQKTLELYQRGETNGTFQFESPGMQKYLKELKPDRFEDLIAMNALYRPGPIGYIPNFIARKHGREAITYDLPAMKEYLEDTYGITVYQEQVMLLSQKLADFTKGDADTLRKAMGKKDKATLDKMRSKFMQGANAKGHPIEKLEKIWTDWEAFAQYAFNKSHSTCYAFVAYQTAYLKAHYPGEYMSAVLTNNLGNIDKITFFMEECKRSGIPVLGPDINESRVKFAVNKNGEIRFGLGAVKGVGEAAVQAIIEEREANGPFKSIFDLTKRVNLRAVNKKTIEALAFAGGLDCFTGVHRAQYLKVQDNEETNIIEKAIRYGNAVQNHEADSQQSLFGGGGGSGASDIPEPGIPAAEPWNKMDQLRYEKEVVGMFITGHPLDDYRMEINQFCRNSLSELKDLKLLRNKDITLAGIVTNVIEGISKNGKPYGRFMLEDYTDTFEFALFGEDFAKYKSFMTQSWFLFIKGKVQTRWNKEDDLEFKITNIQLLTELKDKMVKSVILNIDSKKVDSTLVAQLQKLFESYKGNCMVRMNLLDSDKKWMVNGFSQKYRIQLDNEVIKTFDQLEIRYQFSQAQ